MINSKSGGCKWYLPCFIFCIISFTSDWLFPTIENKKIVEILNQLGKKVSFTEIQTDKGHDSFLLEEPDLYKTISGFLKSN